MSSNWLVCRLGCSPLPLRLPPRSGSILHVKQSWESNDGCAEFLSLPAYFLIYFFKAVRRGAGDVLIRRGFERRGCVGSDRFVIIVALGWSHLCCQFISVIADCGVRRKLLLSFAPLNKQHTHLWGSFNLGFFSLFPCVFFCYWPLKLTYFHGDLLRCSSLKTYKKKKNLLFVC